MRINHYPPSLIAETYPIDPRDIKSENNKVAGCARIIWIQLSWAKNLNKDGWVNGWSYSTPRSFVDRHNLELAHQHLVFESTGENIGFGPLGSIKPNKQQGFRISGYLKDFFKFLIGTTYSYKKIDALIPKKQSVCYDEKLMRQAVRDVKPSKWYLLVGQNCQDYIDKVLRKYFALYRQTLNK